MLSALIAASGLTMAASAAGAAPTPASVAHPQPFHAGRYIVQGASSRGISTVGGKVITALPVIHGYVAQLSGPAATKLGNTRGVALTVDAQMKVQSDASASTASGGSSAYRTVTGANQLSANRDGSGVTVAVIDTGIDAALPDFGNRVVGGVDLSGGNSPYVDGYGHGTFVAGIIASNGVSSSGTYVGEAPGANLVSVKVADAQGNTTEGQVIEGIAWAALHHNGPLGIDVINLSLGVMPTTPAALDPLDQAVEFAWDQGVVVVVSAGNFGPNNGTITSPGDDPLVITVGALDDGGCVLTSPCAVDPTSATIPKFSSVGPTMYDGAFKPDLIASGRSLISLAVPGSTIYNEHQSAITGPTGSNFVGSGTSFSAAVTSGAVALVLQSRPNLSPNQVKASLLGTAKNGPTGDPFVDGHGSLYVPSAVVTSSTYNLDQQAAVAAELHWLPSTNGISLDQTWAFSTWDPALWKIHDSSGHFLGAAWNGAAWNGAAWNGAAWNGAAWNNYFAGAAWNGAAWNGAAWNGAAWNGAAWNGAAWNGAAWNGAAWNGHFNGAAWNGAAWNGAAWNGAAWNGAAWNGDDWNGAAWNGAAWNGAAWNGAAWNGAAWNGAAWNGAAWNNFWSNYWSEASLNGAAWNGAAWNGAAWNGAARNGAAWNGAAWNGAAWNGAAWNGAAWNGAAWNWAAWNGAAWNGAAWNGAAWNGAAWNGAAWNGAAWNGAAWNGAAWNSDEYD